MLHPNLNPFCLMNVLCFICVKEDVVIVTPSYVYSQFPITAFPVSLLDGKSILWSTNKQVVVGKGVWMCISSAYSLAIRLTTSNHWKSEGRESIYPKISRVIITAFFLWRCDPTRVMVSSFLRFLDHTQRRTTVGRIPLDEWSARRRDLYLTTHNTHNRKHLNPRSQQASGHWDRQ
jgi:hypothetical protein